MSEIRTARQFIVDFLEKNKEIMGDIQTVLASNGKIIDLNNMTDEEAAEAANMLMAVGTPTRFGALAKVK